MKKYLFICTKNFYRSRFAESYFNYLSNRYEVDAMSKSAGLKIHLADEKASKEGEISLIAKNKLDSMGISSEFYSKKREKLTEKMLENSDYIIVMDEDEHFSMFLEHFPKYIKKVIFYRAKDIEHCDADITLNYIKKMIESEIYYIFTNK